MFRLYISSAVFDQHLVRVFWKLEISNIEEIVKNSQFKFGDL